MGIFERYGRLTHHFMGKNAMKETKLESEVSKNPVSSSFQCVDAIEISMFIEKEGLSFYEKAAKRVLEPSVKNMFLRLAEEEREHIQILQTKIQFLRPTIYAKAAKSETLVSFIREQLEDKIFPTFDKNFAKEFKNDLDVLEYGIECEKRSIQVLNNLLAEEKKLDVKSIFAHLVVEEKKHLSLLEELKAKI
jgi:rubrerythrin